MNEHKNWKLFTKIISSLANFENLLMKLYIYVFSCQTFVINIIVYVSQQDSEPFPQKEVCNLFLLDRKLEPFTKIQCSFEPNSI